MTLRVTLDTGAVGPERKRVEAACAGRDVELANTTVTERELRGKKIAPLSKPILETAVCGESHWDLSVWGGDPVEETLVLDETPLGAGVLAGDEARSLFERILEIIGDGGFPKPGKRDALTPGQHHQLRDAIAFEAHVREKRDIFVTNDRKHFIRDGRREQLAALGSTLIMTVDEFCDHVASAPGF